MRAVVLIEHDTVRGLVAVGIIAEAIDQRVRDQLLVLLVAARVGAQQPEPGTVADRSELVELSLPACLASCSMNFTSTCSW
jgi:hypothetical protein